MSITPNNIFSRLEVLKKWQEEQQERLLKQQTEQDSLTERLSNALDEKPIEDTPVSSKCVDDVQLPEPKDFNELLDEKLKMIDDTTETAAKPKRPFLRKGTGLVRFRTDSPKPMQRSTPKQKPAELSKPTWGNVLAKSVDEPSYEQQAFEKQLEKDLLFKADTSQGDELRIFEFLEKKALSNSFCSTSSVVMRVLEMTSPKRIASIPPTSEYRDESAWSEDSESSSTLSESSDVSESVQPIYNDVATNTDPASPPGNSDVLRSRLEELEKEIETFRQENAKIKRTKSSFDKEKNKLEAEIEEQRKRLDDEKKRLAREKLLNEKYLREMKTGGTRKERDEIAALKSQLASVTEELKQKESRYGASQARQRNQIRSLEKEVAALKADNEQLRKLNGKLQAQLKAENRRSQPPSDTKVLHEINRNLSLLTKQHRLIDQNDKENDPSDPSFISVTKDYEKAFGKHKPDKKIPPRMDTRASSESSDCLVEKSKPKASADRIERLLPDGTKEITYSNGNVKTIRSNKVSMRYYNGDIKETNAETATVRYFYAEARIWHTTYAEDGLEVLEFPDGQVEKRRRDGSTEVSFPDGCVRCTTPGGTETIHFPDETVVVRKTNGDKTLMLPNGQKEFHTEEHMRREYPDGTVKLLYPDGAQETRYANGRIRLKDSNGVLIMDTADN